MKKLTILVSIILCVALVGSAMALPKGKTAEIDTKMGKVVFSGDTHSVNKCNECHTKAVVIDGSVDDFR